MVCEIFDIVVTMIGYIFIPIIAISLIDAWKRK